MPRRADSPGTPAPAAPTGYFSNNVTFLEFDPSTNATPIPLLDKQPGTAANPWPGAKTFTYQCWFLLLPSGQLLCSAGQNTLYLYTPDGAPQPGWQPTITSVPTTMVTGETYTITGTQLNGLSQAVSYGDDGQMATNYPLVRLTDIFVNPQTVAYLRTFNFSSLGVAVAGGVSADLEVPCDLPPGGYNLQVIANGIASDPVPVQIVGRSTLPLGTAKNATELYNSANVPPQLPGKGMPGDVVAAHTSNVDGVSFVELWVCIRSAGTLRGQTVGSSWARIQFDSVVTMPGA
jgi:hypothetical protein